MALIKISEVDDVALSNSDAARPSPLFRQLVFRDFHTFRVDLRQLVRAKFTKNWNAFARNYHAVGQRVFGRNSLQIDLSGPRIEAANEVAALHGEPKYLLLIKHWRVRVTGSRVRHLVLAHISRARIKLANESGIVSGIPNVSLTIERQAVRPCTGRLQGILAHCPVCGIEPPQSVARLPRPPERTIRRDRRIMRIRVRRRYTPLPDGYV